MKQFRSSLKVRLKKWNIVKIYEQCVWKRIIDEKYIDEDVKVRDQCHITGNYKGFAYRYYDINNFTQLIHNLKTCDSWNIIQVFTLL